MGQEAIPFWKQCILGGATIASTFSVVLLIEMLHPVETQETLLPSNFWFLAAAIIMGASELVVGLFLRVRERRYQGLHS